MQKETATPLDFDRKNIPTDAGAGLTMAMVAVPDAIASAILAGVNPVFAFNSMMVGMPVSGLFTGSQFMNCALTSAMMLVVAGAVAGTAEVDMVPLLVTSSSTFRRPVQYRHVVLEDCKSRPSAQRQTSAKR